MNYIIIGLGNFGSALATDLTAKGHEVIAADSNMKKVEAFKNVITHTIMVNAREMEAVKTLPLKNADAVIVAIGEDFGASVEVTANIKQIGVKKLISRAISPVHQTVLEAIGIEDIVHPEQESAERLSKRLQISGILDSFHVAEGYQIIETDIPVKYIGKTVAEVDLRKNYNVNIVTIIKKYESKNAVGGKRNIETVVGVVSPKRKFEENDILILFGAMEDIEKLLELK